MKKIALLALAVLVLVFTQCKKKDVAAVSDMAKKVQITFTPTNDNSKSVFDPATGFGWNPSSTEYIHVGGSAHGYLGTISNSGDVGYGSFKGEIEEPNKGETLYFIYLGNGDKTITDGATNTTMEFWNQSETGTTTTVTNYHIAVASDTYEEGKAFSATLDTKIALAYIDLSAYSGEAVYLHGDAIYSKATVDFTNGSITPTKGIISLGTGGSAKYVALLPQPTPAETTVEFASTSKKGTKTFLRGIKPKVFYSVDETTPFTPTTESLSLPSCVLPHLFTVYPSTMVRFSQGNLRYDNSSTKATKWSFATNQYDYIGSWALDSMIDLFCWGQNGINGTEMNSKNSYKTSDSDLTYDNNGEWGKAARIGGINNWRTLKKEEVDYLLAQRKTASGVRYAKAQVAGKNGIILLPDDWSTSYYALNNTNTPSANYAVNVITSSDWATYLEANGAVFLPAAGFRSGSTYYNTNGCTARYWSSSYYEGGGKAYNMVMSNTELSSYGSPDWRNAGYAVRLVSNY